MAVKTVSTRAAIVSRKKGHSAVEKSAYISRETIECERDGQVYYPKYSEDLVFSRVMLPEGAPERLKDRAVLWNEIENIEKRKDAQLARTFRVCLPNEWSYELATEVMQDYVRKNFTSQGMCCDFAIHDSENKKTHQRNLHCHIMLTMRPLTEKGEWGDKQHFVYKLDKDGNKIRKKNGKGYEGHSEPTTDWNSKEKIAEWRKDLADTINSVNEREGNTENFWDNRSFEARGLETIPEVHLGARACAAEDRGIRTERGDTNRRIRMANTAVIKAREAYVSEMDRFAEILFGPLDTLFGELTAGNPAENVREEAAPKPVSVGNDGHRAVQAEIPATPKGNEHDKAASRSAGKNENPHGKDKETTEQSVGIMHNEIPAKPVKTVGGDLPAVPSRGEKVKTEIVAMLDRVMELLGRLVLPVAHVKFLGKIPGREKARDVAAVKKFLSKNGIETFAQLEAYRVKRTKEFDEIERSSVQKNERLAQLKKLAKAYAEYEPYKAVHDKSVSLSGLAKMKFDREHSHELKRYGETRKGVTGLLTDGERKIAPKAWKKEQEQIEAEMPGLKSKHAEACRDLAIVEVVSHNKKNLEQIEHGGRGAVKVKEPDPQKGIPETPEKNAGREKAKTAERQDKKMKDINLTENEKRLLFRMDGTGKTEVQRQLSLTIRLSEDAEQKRAAESMMVKLDGMTDAECRETVRDIQKNYRLPGKPKSIGEYLAVARQESGAEKLAGHDIMGIERFEDGTRHMVVFEVLYDGSPIGKQGEKVRLFLTDEGYSKMLDGQEKGMVRIENHAAVRDGQLHYDHHRDRGMDR